MVRRFASIRTERPVVPDVLSLETSNDWYSADMPVLALILALSFLAGGLARGWVVIPFSLLVPVGFIAIGAFDDGEPVRDILIFTALFPACAAVGYGIGRFVVRGNGSSEAAFGSAS